MDKLICTIDSVAVLRKEVKAYINAVVKSKFFTAEDGSIKINAILEQSEGKKSNDFLSVGVQNEHTIMEFCVELPKKVSKKVDNAMFEKMTAVYAKRKTPLTITVALETASC